LPLCPELELWLLAADTDLERACRELAEAAAPPFWAFCWGAGQALARYLLDHPGWVRGRRVVDLGAGSGVAGIAAARAGAEHVTAVDLDPAAREAAVANAELNGVRVQATSKAPRDWDLLLAADVLYEAALRDEILAMRSPERRILVADPHRLPDHARIGTVLLEVAARTLPDVDPPVRKVTISCVGEDLAEDRL